MFWAIVVMTGCFWAAARFRRLARQRQMAMDQLPEWTAIGPCVSVARNMPMIRVRWQGQTDTSIYSNMEDTWQAAATINWLLSLKSAERSHMDRIIGTSWREN